MKKFIVHASKSDVRRKRDIRAAQTPTRGRRIVASALDDNSPEHETLSNYLPSYGEGNTMASQIATAVFKLIYKWFNDGDVYDNTQGMEGWANDLSSYANWLYKYVPKTRSILADIAGCHTDQAYEDILDSLMYAVSDAEDLENWYNKPKVGSVYNCDGPFAWQDPDADDEEDPYFEEGDQWGEDEEDY